jgi:1-acyl-sn-glycerol-3-phosphate acyltransferase
VNVDPAADQLRTTPQPGAVAFGMYALVAVVAVALACLLLLVVTPGLARRRRVVRTMARAAFAVARIPLSASGTEHVGAGPCVVVANHASYLDGMILTAALPPTFSFVIKREVTRVPFLHLLLRRIGSQFVERFDRHRGGVDARRILRAAASGEALAFFPEGTFRREPGLGRFHSGAFATAARSELPVVPVVIRGSRTVLPSGAWLPRRGRLEVIVRPAISATGEPAEAAVHLRDASRRAMLEVLDEPDLAARPDSRS